MGQVPDQTMANPPMPVEVAYQGDHLSVHTEGDIVRVVGEIDAFSAVPLREAFEPCMAARGPVRLDLSEVAFMDGGGLRALMHLDDRLGDRLTIIGASPAVRLVLDATGTSTRFASP